MGQKKKRRARRKEKAREQPHWRLIEQVVATIERAINPQARVQHNVHLPDLSTGTMRQCDGVIEVGKEPRITRSIIEVQDRKTDVDVPTLEGWYAKMLAVGAQHLICVSATGFTEPVKLHVAKKYGPAVILLRLQELPRSQWPLSIPSGKVPVQHRHSEVDQSRLPITGTEPGTKVSFKLSKDTMFRWNKSTEPVSATQLLEEWCHHPAQRRLPAGDHVDLPPLNGTS